MRRAAIVLAVVGCGSAQHEAAPVPAAAVKSASEVHVDRRVELVSIVMRLADAEEYRNALATPYVADVDRWFAPFANHPAIAATKALREQHGISYDAPMSLAIHLDDQLQPWGIDQLAAADERWRGVDVAAYVATLREFAVATKLDAFLAAHAEHFRAVEAVLHARIDAEDPSDWFDSIFGVREHARYVVVPGMLEGGNNYGPHCTRPDGTLEMYQVLGVYGVDARGIPTIDDEEVDTLIHEMAHSYVNPVLATHQAALAHAGEILFGLVQPTMEEQAYRSWLTMLDESCVRATTVLFVRDRRGDAAAAEAIHHEMREGFMWTAELEAVLRAHRRERGGLEALMPAIIARLDELAARDAHGLPPRPFDGPLNEVFEHDLVVVAPTTTDAAVTTYVHAVHDQVLAKQPLVEASDHVVRDHRGVNLIAYGSPQTNPVIAGVLAQSKLVIGSDLIAVGKHRFTGAGLVLIACWIRADDSQHGAAIYAAANEHDLVEVNSIRHGGTDWLVARRTPKGFEVLGSGNFPHAADGTWLLP